MDVKMIGGIVLILGIASIALLAAPIQAYANETGISDFLQTQERERLRTHDQDRSGDMLQTQTQERLRTQDCNGDCNGAGTQTQYRNGERVNEDAPNNICNCAKNMEQHRYQCREGQEA